jgi:hypothetical protein
VATSAGTRSSAPALERAALLERRLAQATHQALAAALAMSTETRCRSSPRVRCVQHRSDLARLRFQLIGGVVEPALAHLTRQRLERSRIASQLQLASDLEREVRRHVCLQRDVRAFRWRRRQHRLRDLARVTAELGGHLREARALEHVFVSTGAVPVWIASATIFWRSGESVGVLTGCAGGNERRRT